MSLAMGYEIGLCCNNADVEVGKEASEEIFEASGDWPD